MLYESPIGDIDSESPIVSRYGSPIASRHGSPISDIDNGSPIVIRTIKDCEN